MIFSRFDEHTAFVLRESCREAFDLLVIERDPAVTSAREAVTRAHIEQSILQAADAGERSPRRLVEAALAEVKKLPPAVPVAA